MAKSCYEYAIWVIGKYPKTEKELRIKMYQQGYDSETVSRTLEKLKQDNFVNDELFAESYINSEVIRKGRPLIVITQKLEMRGKIFVFSFCIIFSNFSILLDMPFPLIIKKI